MSSIVNEVNKAKNSSKDSGIYDDFGELDDPEEDMGK